MANNIVEDHVRRELVRMLVSRTMTCPRTGALLDMRDCVVLLDSDGDPAYVLSQKGWAQIVEEGSDELLRVQSGLVPDPATVAS